MSGDWQENINSLISLKSMTEGSVGYVAQSRHVGKKPHQERREYVVETEINFLLK